MPKMECGLLDSYSVVSSACSTPLVFPLQPKASDKLSELLPLDWSANKELYSLRYKAKDDDTSLLLKAILDNAILTFYLMVAKMIDVTSMLTSLELS